MKSKFMSEIMSKQTTNLTHSWICWPDIVRNRQICWFQTIKQALINIEKVFLFVLKSNSRALVSRVQQRKLPIFLHVRATCPGRWLNLVAFEDLMGLNKTSCSKARVLSKFYSPHYSLRERGEGRISLSSLFPSFYLLSPRLRPRGGRQRSTAAGATPSALFKLSSPQVGNQTLILISQCCWWNFFLIEIEELEHGWSLSCPWDPLLISTHLVRAKRWIFFHFFSCENSVDWTLCI